MILEEIMNKKQIAAKAAAKYIKDGMVLGLGTGSTVYFLLEEVSELIKAGMNFKCVATSLATEEIAKKLNIPIYDINDVTSIDLAIDGVDEIDGDFNAIKGGGGALFREKIVAKVAKEVIWIMDDSKVVDKLGSFPLPIEVLPFGVYHVITKLEKIGMKATLRIRDGKIFVSDNNNYILDLHLEKPLDVYELILKLKKIIGVIEIGLFPNYCDRIVVGTYEGSQVLENHLKYQKK
jgi:ribose 5-phosphate isomerase A